MMGKPNRSCDTAHFWVEDNKENIHDNAKDFVSQTYEYVGRMVSPSDIYDELEIDFNDLVIQDILYGLENFSELRPSKERIEALESIKNPDNNILDMINIFKSGHGVLSQPHRIKSLKDLHVLYQEYPLL